MPSIDPKLRIRRARPQDASRIAELSAQLGYPVKVGEIIARLKLVLKERRAACFVAETEEHEVVGWVHVSVTPLLEVPCRAEVNGLVVDEKVRSRGAGWCLLEAAEKWARKMHCAGMSVRSNVIRDRAHAFYLCHGYQHYKTQKAFRKAL